LLALNVGEWESTIEHARIALALNPSYVDAMNWLRLALNALGRYKEADASLEQMLVTDPLNIIGRYSYAGLLRLTGRVAEAHEVADQLLAQSELMGYWAHADTALLTEGKIAEGLSWALRVPLVNHVVVAFNDVGEYDEARRVDMSLTHWVDLAQGHWDEALPVAQRIMSQEPDNEQAVAVTAWILYLSDRIDEALPLYERLLDRTLEGQPVAGPYPLVQTMRLALARRKSGDEDGAQAAVQIVRQDHAAGRAAGRKNHGQDRAEAMIAAFEHNPDGVIAALQSAIQRGLRDPQVFDDPVFKDLWDEPRFVALQQELDAILATEHDKVLQLICFNNPVPDDWQPLPETCEGVEEQHGL
jgi:tetratricopeptide (TPR) repeat protein